jgi:hypothetical protein
MSVRRVPWLGLSGLGLLGFAAAAVIYGLATFSPEGMQDFDANERPGLFPLVVAFYSILILSTLAVLAGLIGGIVRPRRGPMAVRPDTGAPALPNAESLRLWNERQPKPSDDVQRGGPSDIAS